ncbi:MFS transporter [Micromonospora sp. NPDC050397]|uniref:MFS transporter n=1 Tax=Micromonospora sp. NPDC050397 TaxID=3364279 RepID=UPI00384B38C7
MTRQLTYAPENGACTPPSLWRSRDFLLLWGGQTVGEMGTRISGIAVPVLAAETLHASVFEISLLTLLAWLPYLLFSLPAGILADRVDQRRLMIVCDLGRFALLVPVPLVAVAWELTLWFLYVVVGLTGVLTVGFTVAYRSAFPRLVRADQLVDGNAKLVMGRDFAELLGRVNAAFLRICYGVIPLGALFGGTLGSHLGLRTALWICVLGTWSAALFVLFSPLCGMRDLPAG